MLHQTLNALHGCNKRKVATIGHVHFPDGCRIPLGLRYSPTFGTKLAYCGKSGRGGGFDGDRWTLAELFFHEMIQFGTLQDGVSLVLNDGTRIDRESIKALAEDWQKETAAAV